MAKSGTLNSSKYGDRYLSFTWERTGYNRSKKQSTIEWTLKGAGGSGYYKAGNFLVTIDGDTEYSTSQNSRIELWNGTTVATGTKTITHDSTGTKSFKVYIEAGIYTYAVNCDGSKTFTLDPFYDIKFNGNGGSGVPATQTKMYGVDLTLSSTKPTREGYVFEGWGTSSSDTSVNYEAGDVYESNASDILYAIWSKKITLSFNGNGGSGVPSSKNKTVYNETTSYKFTIPNTKPTKTGYTFLGWSKSSSATSATYSAGGTITLSASDILYAVWKENTLTVRYYSNYATAFDGTSEPENIVNNNNVIVYEKVYYYDNKYENGLTNYKDVGSGLYMYREGYYATGDWGTSTSGGYLVNEDKAFATGQKLAKALGKDISKGSTSVNVYAQWKRISLIVTLDAFANGGVVNGLDFVTKDLYYGDSIGILPIAEKKNYKFIGWYTTPTGTVEITENFIVTKDVTLYARFELQANAYVKEESYKTAMTFIKENETYKKIIVYVKKDGEYKEVNM